MILQIDASSGIAIYEQVVRQLKYAVASGSLRQGELVPSVRELSKQLAINPNTVARAYRHLQDDRVLEAVRGLGMQVCDGAQKRCRRQRQQLLSARLDAVLEEAQQSGLSDEEVQQLVQQAMTRMAAGE